MILAKLALLFVFIPLGMSGAVILWAAGWGNEP